MKRITLLFMLFITLCGNAQNVNKAKAVLDKAAGIIGRSGGASANFTINSTKYGNIPGSIAIKGNKFYAQTPQAIVWYNGKNQWTYMKKNNEVNISTPNEAKRLSMNPYTFITMYNRGYDLSMKSIGTNYQVHLIAQNPKRSVQEMYILLDQNNNIPKEVKMRQGNNWTTIQITNFKAKDQSDKLFTFRAKDFPKAEIIDLR